jgi:phage shock protein E
MIVSEIDCQKICQQLQSGAQLVDVRSQAEYASGSISGAINLPLPYISFGCCALDREKAVLVFCGSGKRSSQAKTALSSIGFSQVLNIGGYPQLKTCEEIVI